MTKLSHEEKNRIIKRDLPGFKLVEQVSDESTEDRPDYDSDKSKPDVGTPDFRELRRKYFGTTEEPAFESDARLGKPGSNPDDTSNEDELVQVTPENSADPLDRGARPKSVVISNGEIKGSQG
jgi:hypothetical protein